MAYFTFLFLLIEEMVYSIFRYSYQLFYSLVLRSYSYFMPVPPIFITSVISRSVSCNRFQKSLFCILFSSHVFFGKCSNFGSILKHVYSKQCMGLQQVYMAFTLYCAFCISTELLKHSQLLLIPLSFSQTLGLLQPNKKKFSFIFIIKKFPYRFFPSKRISLFCFCV